MGALTWARWRFVCLSLHPAALMEMQTTLARGGCAAKLQEARVAAAACAGARRLLATTALAQRTSTHARPRCRYITITITITISNAASVCLLLTQRLTAHCACGELAAGCLARGCVLLPPGMAACCHDTGSLAVAGRWRRCRGSCSAVHAGSMPATSMGPAPLAGDRAIGECCSRSCCHCSCGAATAAMCARERASRWGQVDDVSNQRAL